MNAATPSAARRVLLVPARDRSDELLRRYRLARMRVEGRTSARTADANRFAHLKRMHD